MNWGSLFFSAEGRVGQKDFWLAAIILFVFGVVIHAAVVVGTLVWLLSTYCWICIYSKRLHDMGRSGWVQIMPWILGLFCLIFGGAALVSSLFGLIFTGLPHFVGGMVLGGMSMGFGLFAMSAVVHLIFLLWLGLTPGQAGPNRYGPEPGAPALAGTI
jgi:uncharacterized membrane protein YhaH (DUF805 family)